MGNHESQRAAAECPVSLEVTALAVADHSQTTANTVSDHSRDEGRTQAAHAPEASDKPPTEAEKTSDRTADLQAFESRLDKDMQRLVDELATCSQIRAASTSVQSADANALRLPVSESGRALTDDPVGQFQRDYNATNRIPELQRRVEAKTRIAVDAQLELKLNRRARRKAVDIELKEGRLKVARYALTHGTRSAAEAYCLDPQDPKSIKRMQRNVQNYIHELRKVEGIK